MSFCHLMFYLCILFALGLSSKRYSNLRHSRSKIISMESNGFIQPPCPSGYHEANICEKTYSWYFCPYNGCPKLECQMQCVK